MHFDPIPRVSLGFFFISLSSSLEEVLEELEDELLPSLSLELEDVPLELELPELDFLRGFFGAAGFLAVVVAAPFSAGFFFIGFFFSFLSPSLLPLLLELLDYGFLGLSTSFFPLSLSEPEPLPWPSLEELGALFF